MTDEAVENRLPPRGAVIGFIVLALLLSGWLMWRTNSSAAARECRAKYQSAHTAADTAVVDLVVPTHHSTDVEAHSCGFIRGSASWQ